MFMFDLAVNMNIARIIRMMSLSLHVPFFQTVVTTILSVYIKICLFLHRAPQVKTATQMAKNSLTFIFFTWRSPRQGPYNHLRRKTAPKPKSEASVKNCKSYDVTNRSWINSTPFQSGRNSFHHKMSALASAFKVT